MNQLPQRVVQAITSFDGKQTHELEEQVEAVAGEPASASSLLSLCQSEEEHVVTAATWLLKRLAESSESLPSTSSRQCCQLLRESLPWPARLHLLQTLPWVQIDKRQSQPLFEQLVLDTEDSNKFVRAWALSGLVEVADRWPEFRDATRRALRQVSDEEAASVKARVRAVVKKHAWLRTT